MSSNFSAIISENTKIVCVFNNQSSARTNVIVLLLNNDGLNTKKLELTNNFLKQTTGIYSMLNLYLTLENVFKHKKSNFTIEKNTNNITITHEENDAFGTTSFKLTF